MKKILLILGFIGCYFLGSAQQLPFSTQISDNKFLWNPAFTAEGTEMKLSAYGRQRWLGVKDAPRTVFASGQYPFVDYNMSAGGTFYLDQTGPISKVGIKGMYSYKLRKLLSRHDHLSIGINGGISQFSFDPTNEIFSPNDPLLQAMRVSKMNPTLGVGMAYISDTETFDNNTAFYFGMAMNQLYATEIIIGNANFERTSHYFLNVGAKIYNYGIMLEPYLNIDYTSPELLRYTFNLNMELEEVFWAGIGYANTKDISIQGGYILPDFGSSDGKLKIGAIGNISLTSEVMAAGPGMEIYIAYIFDVD